MSETKRLRLFAGPNGSGKSTLFDHLVKSGAFHSYYHVNPDMIMLDLKKSLDFDNWGISLSHDEFFHFLESSPLQSLASVRFNELLTCRDNTVSFKDPSSVNNSYLNAAIADFIRFKMVQSESSFSFETILSHKSKLEEVEEAKKAGYKIYLYFITTSNPVINENRVKNRVESGGHDVPPEKIRERYYRTMDNLYGAFQLADRAYFFDNSTRSTNNIFDFFAEKKGNKLQLSEDFPKWFYERVLNRMAGNDN